MTVATAPPGQDLALSIPDLKSRKKDAVLAEMVAAAQAAGVVTNEALLLELLRLRERVGSTSLGKGVALPHGRSITVMSPRVVVARSARGIDWGADDDVPVQLVLLALAPAGWSGEAYHGLVARAAASARLQRTRHKLLCAPAGEALHALWREALA
jgi:mannitol/fructose-specific phosphotransferase system IIA component (Ntr-type)